MLPKAEMGPKEGGFNQSEMFSLIEAAYIRGHISMMFSRLACNGERW